MDKGSLYWRDHERDCCMEWTHLWFLDVVRDAGGELAVTATTGAEVPEAIASIAEIVMSNGANRVNINGYACPEHGGWVSLFIYANVKGLGEKVMHISFRLDASREEMLAEFRSEVVIQAGAMAKETVVKLMQHMPPGVLKQHGGKRSLENRIEDMRRRTVKKKLDELNGEG